MGTAVSDIAVRRLTQDDVDRLVAMESANQPTPWTEGVFKDELAAENRAYLAVLDGGSILGFGGVLVSDEEAHILNLLIAPDQRRKGYARRLMIGLVDAALEMGARHLILEVRSKNHSAIELYRRFGMAPVGARTDYYGDDDAVIMWACDIDSALYATTLEGLR